MAPSFHDERASTIARSARACSNWRWLMASRARSMSAALS